MIALLGATGRIGRPVAEDLAARGADVRALVRDPAGAALPVPAVRADLRDRESLRRALDGCDRLLLLTPHGPDQDLWEQRALTAARDAGVTGVVKISGGEASLSPNGPTSTAVGHWRTEGLVEDLGFRFAHLRPSFLAQNLLTTAAPLVSRRRLLVGPFRDEPIAMVDARDVAACAATLLTAPALGDRAWSVTGPGVVTHREIAAQLGVRSVRIPVRLAAAALRRQGQDPWEVDHAMRMVRYLRAGADAAPTDAVARITGRPARTLREFLADHASAFGASPTPETPTTRRAGPSGTHARRSTPS